MLFLGTDHDDTRLVKDPCGLLSEAAQSMTSPPPAALVAVRERAADRPPAGRLVSPLLPSLSLRVPRNHVVMGRKQRQAAVRDGRVAKKLALTDKVSAETVVLVTKAAATQTAYSRYFIGARGWIEWIDAQGVSSTDLGEGAALRVAEYYIFRTDTLTLGLSVAGQLLPAIESYYAAETTCAKGEWTVIFRAGSPTSTSGNPVKSSAVSDVKGAHKKALVRAGNATSDSVDVVEPVHLRTFFSLHLSGRVLTACDPEAVLVHATVLMGMSLILRCDELTALTTTHLGRTELHLKLSIPEGTKTIFQKKEYTLTPWPTAVRLDPRYVAVYSLVVFVCGRQCGFYCLDSHTLLLLLIGASCFRYSVSMIQSGPCVGFFHVDASAWRSSGVHHLCLQAGRWPHPVL